MELKIEVYGCLCELATFTINWISADYNDFWEKYDRDSQNAEDYCCWDMRFTGSPATQEILDKYKISLDEYSEIVNELEDKLSFWTCWRCS